MIILRPEPDIPINSAGDIDLLDGGSWPLSGLRESLEKLLLTTGGLGLGFRFANCGPLKTIFKKIYLFQIYNVFSMLLSLFSRVCDI